MAVPPIHNIDIIGDGDAIIVVKGMSLPELKDEPVGLRVSTHALSMTSPVFRALLQTTPSTHPASVPKIIIIPDDGDTILMIFNILHLRNDMLPARISAEALYKLAVLAEKYQCVTAVGRATLQWFDRLYAATTKENPIILVEAAYLLDEPNYFTRFTERWITSEPLNSKFTTNSQNQVMHKLARDLSSRRQSLIAAARADLDLIVDPCSSALCEAAEHYIDYMPGMMPDRDESGKGSSICRVDSEAACIYLGALRDKHIWPSTAWTGNLEGMIKAIMGFKIPDYDDSDRCEFCEDIKQNFGENVDIVKKMYTERLWGLCLDCFKAGGVNPSDCRWEHNKARVQPRLITEAKDVNKT